MIDIWGIFADLWPGKCACLHKNFPMEVDLMVNFSSSLETLRKKSKPTFSIGTKTVLWSHVRVLSILQTSLYLHTRYLFSRARLYYTLFISPQAISYCLKMLNYWTQSNWKLQCAQLREVSTLGGFECIFSLCTCLLLRTCKNWFHLWFQSIYNTEVSRLLWLWEN